MHRWLVTTLFFLSVSGCENRDTGQEVQQGEVEEPPRWHFDRIQHGLGDMTLTDIYGRDDGTVVAVGWYGTILSNRVSRANPDGLWHTMESHTTEHLTGIYGVDNGLQFNQERRDGEMFAVGWNGTLLHFHPNPDNLPNPEPEDGVWQVIGGPGRGFAPRMKIDPFCPDYDGDGILDDGGGDPTTGGPDGWWSRRDTCVDGASSNCDDNCRTSPNGPYRPIVDLNGNFGTGTDPQNCLEFVGDGGSAANVQTDPDANGVGSVCEGVESAIDEFRPTLFDVWATIHPSDDTQLVVAAVGENGALLSYVGPNAAQVVTLPALPISDREAWIAQEELPYWYTNDCPFLGAPATPADTCSGSGRVTPSCPAQCNSYKTTCDCPVDQGQCCAPGGDDRTNGVACAGPGCVSTLGDQTGARAGDGCGVVSAGVCVRGCPHCFRRLDKTLRAITSDGSRLLAVGASGTVVYLPSVDDPTGVWTHPHCGAATPSPLDERPILTAVSAASDGSFEVVGAAGAVVVINPLGGCDQSPRCGAPPAFLSGAFSQGAGRAFAVGDAGTFVELASDSADCVYDPPVVEIDTGINENLYGIWTSSRERMWFVGASGTLIRAGYFAGSMAE